MPNRRMSSSIVVVVNVTADTIAHQRRLALRIKIHILVFRRPPESLYPSVVATASTAIHADGDSVVFKGVYPLLEGVFSLAVL